MVKVVCKQGDITQEQVDAVVNAANKFLLPGGGVCGAIFEAAGPGLAAECEEIGGCPTGEARITRGHKLPARFIIHTVGPVYHQEDGAEAELLQAAYIESLRLADEYDIRSIVFPGISTGAFGYPVREAMQIASDAVNKFLKETPDTSLEKIIFVAYSDQDLEVYEKFFKN
jgi:O-acetyl-ADP-ribose deacetylase (regulator of RNase III)